MKDNTEIVKHTPRNSCFFVFPYALLVPLFVVLLQSVWVFIRGWHFRHNALILHIFPDGLDIIGFIVPGGLGIIVLISFFVIRPFADEAKDRWIALCSCVAVFTLLIVLFWPRLS